MSKYLTLRNIIRASSAFLLLVGFVLMFFNQVDVTYSGKMSFTDAFFGRYGSPITFVGYILLIVSSLTIGGMILLGVLEEKKRIVYFVVAVVLVAASIFIFIEGAVITSNINVNGTVARILLPPALAGVFAILAALGLCFAEFITDKQLG